MSLRTLLRFAARAALLLAVTLNCAPPAGARQRGRQAARTGQTAGRYACPMHPEVESGSPGSCPKCGMTLRQSGVGADAPEAGRAAAPDSPRMSIPDVEMLDQDGRKVHFYSDLVKGKTVAINFIFTSCTTICPPLGATFARVRKELGESAGRDVHLISISVDPVTDTPERLKAWGAKFKAGPGWTFVTGPKPRMDELLRALGAATASPADHTPGVVVGNDEAGQWTRAYGLASPGKLVQLIKDAAAGRLATDVKESN
jgi:cytochrome oxidase Cu insertion factor (SCO1/SenC/PrrC family)